MSFKRFVLFLVFLAGPLYKAHGTQVEILNKKKTTQIIKIKVEQIELGEAFDDLVMRQENSGKSRLFCQPTGNKIIKNPFGDHLSGGGLVYVNYFQKPVRTFRFKSHQECMRIKKDIFAIFEGVNDETPVVIYLNKKTGMIDKVILPFDPYH